MSAAGWPRGALAALMVATACYHVARLAAARPRRGRGQVDVHATHAAMGGAMAVMLLGSLAPGTSGRWALAFTVPTLWFVWRCLDHYVVTGSWAIGQPLQQALSSGAMVYMLAVTALGSAAAGPDVHMAGMVMPGDSGSVFPSRRVIGVLLLGALAGVTLGRACAVGGAYRARTAQRGEAGVFSVTGTCQLATNITTAYMLGLML